MATPTIHALDLGFKGDRDYLHGTDIFNALTRVTGARRGISLRFHRLMHHDVEAVEFGRGENVKDFAGIFLFESGRRTVRIGLRELSSTPTRRIPYDERNVTADAAVRDNSIVSPGPSDFTFIERTVALQKVLLNKVVDDRVRWLFSRLDLDHVPAACRSIRLDFGHRVGVRIVKSAIEVDGEKVGFLCFSRGTS